MPALSCVHAVDKAGLARSFLSHQVQQFKAKSYPMGHAATNYRKWVNATSPYRIQHRRGYEPWFLAHWQHMPLYDVRFRGYGFNKICNVAHAGSQRGVHFAVHPRAWLLHLPHRDTGGRRQMLREMQRAAMDARAKAQANATGNGTPVPASSQSPNTQPSASRTHASLLKVGGTCGGHQ